MVRHTLCISFLVINSLIYGIDIDHLKQNKIFYFFEAETGYINKINFYSPGERPLEIDEVPLCLTDFCWDIDKEPTYIFCEDRTVYKNTSSQVKDLLTSSGKKCIYVALQNEEVLHTITCIFPQWPGLNNVSKTAAYDDNRGIMLFPLIPLKPRWYSELKGIGIRTNFWGEINNCIVCESYVEKPFISDKPGHLCIALPCLVNYYNNILSFFCPVRNTAFSLKLQTDMIHFSNEVCVQTFKDGQEDIGRRAYIFDVWSKKTQVNGVSVQVF